MANLTTAFVWDVVDEMPFAVLGMVTARGEARTVGIVYAVKERRLYIGTGVASWKARHVAGNPHVSLTVPIPKRIPFLPWLKIPQATISFSGTARVLAPEETGPEIQHAVFREIAADPERLADLCVIEVTPQGEFITYGVGVSLWQMRDAGLARGRVAVA